MSVLSHETVQTNIATAIKSIEYARTNAHSEQRHQQGIEWSHMFAKGMGVNLHEFDLQAVAAGERLGILNVLFENTVDEVAAHGILGLLDEALHPELASKVLNEPLESENDLIGAARNQLALITATGLQRFKDIGAPELGHEWVESWYLSVAGLCAAELRRTQYRLGLEKIENLTAIKSIEQGIDKYLDLFGRTGAVELSFMANFPFIHEPTEEKFKQTQELGNDLTPIMRLMQDVKLDLDEEINAGIFAYAAANNLELEQARDRLQSSDKEQQAIISTMRDFLDRSLGNIALDAHAPEYKANVYKMIHGLYKKLA